MIHVKTIIHAYAAYTYLSTSGNPWERYHLIFRDFCGTNIHKNLHDRPANINTNKQIDFTEVERIIAHLHAIYCDLVRF